MNTHHRDVFRAHLARVRPLCAAASIGCITALVAGCGEVEQPSIARPPIEVDEVRCAPVELAGLRRADRLAVAADGRIGLAGTRVDGEGFEAGRVFELDPRGGRPPIVYDDPDPRRLVAWVDGVLHTDGETSLEAADRDAPPPSSAFALPAGLPTDRLEEAFDVYVQGDTALVAASAHDSLRPKALLRLARPAPERPDFTLDAHYGQFDARLGDDWIDATPTVRSFVPGPDDRVYAIGRARAASIADADLPAAERPRTYVGFVSVSRETAPPVQPDVPGPMTLRADEHIVRTWHQPDFWPMRMIRDHAGAPRVLYITGHEGKRIADGWPHMARVSSDGSLEDAIALPLPDFAAHGGVQAALPLDDGGWLLGGSACRPGRSMCKAFVTRMDSAGDVIWTQMMVQDQASTVVDLHLDGDRIYALGVSSPYCCEYDSYRNGAWLVEVMADGSCPDAPTLPPDGRWLR